jgi:hypothetical protein
MKNKVIFFGAILLMFVFVGINKATADCCVNYCAESISGVCNDGSAPNALDCNNITACASSSSSSAASSVTFTNPLGFTTVSGMLDAILNNLMGIIVILAVIFIVIGGIIYITSGGNETMVTRAKKIWAGAIIGLAIALASPTFLKEIQGILGGSGTGGGAASWVGSALTLRQIAVKFLNLLLSLVGILAIISLVIGGGMYLTAYGDERKIDKGKKIITYAIIGIVVALGALVIVRQVDNLLKSTPSVSNIRNLPEIINT